MVEGIRSRPGADEGNRVPPGVVNHLAQRQHPQPAPVQATEPPGHRPAARWTRDRREGGHHRPGRDGQHGAPRRPGPNVMGPKVLQSAAQERSREPKPPPRNGNGPTLRWRQLHPGLQRRPNIGGGAEHHRHRRTERSVTGALPSRPVQKMPPGLGCGRIDQMDEWPSGHAWSRAPRQRRFPPSSLVSCSKKSLATAIPNSRASSSSICRCPESER